MVGQLSLLGRTVAHKSGPQQSLRSAILALGLWLGHLEPAGPDPFSSSWKEAAIALIPNQLGLSPPWALDLVPSSLQNSLNAEILY